MTPPLGDDCPVPISRYGDVVLGHGGGGRLTADLIARVFLPALGNPVLSALEDQATVTVGGARPLYLTAAFVIEEGLPIADLERIARSMRAALSFMPWIRSPSASVRPMFHHGSSAAPAS